MCLPLKHEQNDLLRTILIKRNYQHINDIESLHILSKQSIRKIINELSDEFCETGLDDNDKPNSRGLLIEELIDIVNQFQLEAE